MTLNGQIFTVRPWSPEFGDPTKPAVLLGVAVDTCLLRRSDDDPAVLVSLADRRFALTGSVLAVGPARQLEYYLRQRATHSQSAAERSWLRAAASLLAHHLPERPTPAAHANAS